MFDFKYGLSKTKLDKIQKSFVYELSASKIFQFQRDMPTSNFLIIICDLSHRLVYKNPSLWEKNLPCLEISKAKMHAF